MVFFSVNLGNRRINVAGSPWKEISRFSVIVLTNEPASKSDFDEKLVFALYSFFAPIMKGLIIKISTLKP